MVSSVYVCNDTDVALQVHTSLNDLFLCAVNEFQFLVKRKCMYITLVMIRINLVSQQSVFTKRLSESLVHQDLRGHLTCGLF